MNFDVLVEPLAKEDIQQAIIFYEERKEGLGKESELELHHYFKILETNPFFQIKYDSVHCLPLKKFPFMIHFTLNEEYRKVIVRAVFHTSRNPQEWGTR
ncbi:hypothetical protein [Algoriphagus antarcticus]|uniref:ParE-like toxin of type II ParDE toxin-antitoxin system n=1 Tax=Algoriphagus antarcticus TaxID=238540 RepID=A0A3E0DS62_9BACT|nr:hypothetical protein [Algoriphagus antarcticus]REG86373.1 hypothetical protein C8N25_11277 [Algoriphagus antarcticus]